jgi:nucleotide-binding universal stress UspA family protein
MTTTLIPIDGSQASFEALRYAARHHRGGELLLLYVAPSGRQGDLERGRFLLEEGCRRARSVAETIPVRTRLEVGDRLSKVRQTATEEECSLVVMSSHGEQDLPHVDRVSPETAALTGLLQRPVLLVLPTGHGIRSDSDELADDVEGALTGYAA